LLTQITRSLGAEVFGVVSSEAKREAALASGAPRCCSCPEAELVVSRQSETDSFTGSD
jgi:hypothetical protein